MARAAKKQTAETAWSEPRLMEALRARFKAPEYALLPQVRNSTGFARVTRTADAVAMSLWPSRGMDLHGFEFKSSRHDWIREKENPEKAEEISAFCDRWWIVAGTDDIVQAGELPPTWGLMVPVGKSLAVKVEAPAVNAKPISKAFLAALLRKASEYVVPREEIDAAIARVEAGMEERIENRVKFETARLEVAVKHNAETIEAFEKAAGVSLDSWVGGQFAGARVGAAVRVILDGGTEGIAERLRELRNNAASILASLDEYLGRLGEGT